jgi:hypothetical protein
MELFVGGVGHGRCLELQHFLHGQTIRLFWGVRIEHELFFVGVSKVKQFPKYGWFVCGSFTAYSVIHIAGDSIVRNHGTIMKWTLPFILCAHAPVSGGLSKFLALV